MTKGEFLIKLREALENDLDSRVAQENVDYYDSYIREEMSKGRTESAVVDELGDPWVIARSIIEMEENRSDAGSGSHSGSGQTYSYDNGGYEGYSEEKSGRGFSGYTGGMPKIYALDSWWKKLLLVLGVIGIIMIFFVVVGGIISVFVPMLAPIIFIMILFRFIRRLR